MPGYCILNDPFQAFSFAFILYIGEKSWLSYSLSFLFFYAPNSILSHLVIIVSIIMTMRILFMAESGNIFRLYSYDYISFLNRLTNS